MSVIFRETTLGRFVIGTLGVWSAVTALTMCALGDRVTSKQWQYLMGIPGGKWTWTALFGVAAVAALIGLARRRWALAAVGLCIADVACLFIAGFYGIAPLVDPGLLTLGWLPWGGMMLVLSFCSAMTARPASWF